MLTNFGFLVEKALWIRQILNSNVAIKKKQLKIRSFLKFKGLDRLSLNLISDYVVSIRVSNLSSINRSFRKLDN